MGIKAQDIYNLGIHGAMPESHQSLESRDFIPGLSAGLSISPSNELVRGSVHFLGEVC